jgi:hypothetical protein
MIDGSLFSDCTDGSLTYRMNRLISEWTKFRDDVEFNKMVPLTLIFLATTAVVEQQVTVRTNAPTFADNVATFREKGGKSRRSGNVAMLSQAIKDALVDKHNDLRVRAPFPHTTSACLTNISDCAWHHCKTC